MRPDKKLVAELLRIGTDQNEYLFYLYDRAVNSKNSLPLLTQTRLFFNNLILGYYKPVSWIDKENINRNYHSFTHIEEGIADILKLQIGVNPFSMNNVLLSWFYHDFHYVIGEDNERLSAMRAFEDLVAMGWRAEIAGRIYDLIMFTKHDKNPPENDIEANLLVDIDLLRLAVDDFGAYMLGVKNIREEYSKYSDEEWKKGRLDFLKKFLERKKGKIFGTSEFQNLNKIANANIQLEIRSLERK